MSRAPVPAAPGPLELGELDVALAALDGGAPFKGVLEQLLLDVSLECADELMQLLKEGRGAWLPLLRSRGGPALLLGNALSGTAVALARAGFALTVLDPVAERCRFAAHRDRALAAGATRFVSSAPDGSAPLPFADRAFELVACEVEPPEQSDELARLIAECRRVSGGEVLVVADNRLAYKRSTGRRGEFRIPSPLAFARGVLQPGSLRTVRGYERLLAGEDAGPTRSFALYPHRRDFSQVAELRGGRPRLFIGPQERRNRPKVLAHKAGLFPWLTPSFALVGVRAERAAQTLRAEVLLDELALRTGEPRPELDQLIASRGNTAILHTVPHGASSAPRAGDVGWWTVHVPLSPHQAAQAARHVAATAALRARHPGFPVPEPLFEGELDGLYLTCERRMPGLSAAQLRGDLAGLRRVYAGAAEKLAELVVAPAQALDEAGFQSLIGAKFELVQRFMPDADVRAKLDDLRIETERRLLGRMLPRVFYHADLRAKHVQVEPSGQLIGFLDFGSSEDADLPYFDLVNLIMHDRKQEADVSIGDAWRRVCAPDGLRDFERAALESYAERVGLEPEVCRALESILPVLVGAMAEGNWDFSRPRWVQRGFGL